MESLNIVSWNVYGIKRNLPILHEFCKEFRGIVALQETLLLPHDLSISDTVHEDYNSFSISSMDSTDYIIQGRPRGGLSFLWHKSLDKSVKVISLNSDRLLGLQVTLNDTSVLFINVYMPWESPSNFDHYCMLLGDLQSIINDSTADHACIIGDFNAHPTRRFYDELLRFTRQQDLHISDVALLPPNSFTYVHNRLNVTSSTWLDHCICSDQLHAAINECVIRYDLSNSFDHIPLQISFRMPSLPSLAVTHERSPSISWDFRNQQKSSAFRLSTEVKLRSIAQPADALLCNNLRCRNEQHKERLGEFYSNIINAIRTSGTDTFRVNSGNRRNIPGWNDLVKELYTYSREMFLIWKNNGSQREGPLALQMRQARAQFKFALRQCRLNEKQLRAEAMSRNMASHDYPRLWKDINSLNPKSNKLSQRVGEAIGDDAIARMWGNRFSAILNCIHDHESQNEVNNLISDNIQFQHTDRITADDIQIAIKKLPGNKAAGCDGLPAEAFKYCHPILHIMLAALFNACIIHQFLPQALLLVHLIPLIKNKLKAASDPDNYRPIAITTIASKIFESVLLGCLSPYLHTTDNQFGFKANHSTDTCIYILKELLNYYTSVGSPVYLCFVDVRKAFDRVNYLKLFMKLHKRGTPLYLIGILHCWFSTQQFCAKWGNVLSHSFGSSNGLRQGGILSPHLFNVYTDELNVRLNALPIGCTVNGFTINNLCYADDMVLISPSAEGLQRLINTCSLYAAQNDIIYNESKTQCMSVLPRSLRYLEDPTIHLGNHKLEFVSEFPYLGHIITNNLTDTADIEHRRRKLCSLGNMITRRFAFCHQDTKFLLFRTYCYNVYGCSLWSNYTNEAMRRITVIHNDILRRLTNTPRYHSASVMFTTNRLDNIKIITRRSMASLIGRLQNSENPLISNVLNSEAKLKSKLWVLWNREAHVP